MANTITARISGQLGHKIKIFGLVWLFFLYPKQESKKHNNLSHLSQRNMLLYSWQNYCWAVSTFDPNSSKWISFGYQFLENGRWWLFINEESSNKEKRDFLPIKQRLWFCMVKTTLIAGPICCLANRMIIMPAMGVAFSFQLIILRKLLIPFI
jgi:hypothetical protein